MRRFIEGYRWMWGAIRRWRGGPVWRRALLFALYVLRDLFGTGRRTALVTAAAVALILSAAPLPFRSDEGLAGVEALEVTAHGSVRVRGQWIARSDLGGVLERYDVRYAEVAIEDDASFRIVDDVQRIMVDHGVEAVRVRMTDSF